MPNNQSLSIYVDVSITSAGVGPVAASFGKYAFKYTSAVETGSRLHGPFLTATDVTDFGYSSGSPPHLEAQAFFSQQPHAREFYVIRGDAGDADLTETLDEAETESPGGWFCTGIEERDADSILLLGAWTETRNKIAIAQCNDPSLLAGTGRSYTATFGGTPTDGDYDLIFTGYGLASPVTVTVTRTGGSPADDTALGVAMDAALDTAGAGSLTGKLSVVSNALGVVTIAMADGIPTGTLTSSAPGSGTLTVATTDADIGSSMFDLQYEKTSLWYYSSDSVYLTGALAGRCLSFDLDTQRGGWADKQLVGITGDNLTNTQVAALRAVNCNYYAPAVAYSGDAVLPFTAPGWVSKGNTGVGQPIQVTITKLWLQARLQEALATVKLAETHEIGFDDRSIQRYAAAVEKVLQLGVDAGHLVPFVVPAGEENAGVSTPALFVPRYSQITAANRAAGLLTFTGLVYIKGVIQKVVFSLQARI